jgi:hypothetical protein
MVNLMTEFLAVFPLSTKVVSQGVFSIGDTGN